MSYQKLERELELLPRAIFDRHCTEGYERLKKLSREYRIDLVLMINKIGNWSIIRPDGEIFSKGTVICHHRAYKRYPRKITPEQLDTAFANYLQMFS